MKFYISLLLAFPLLIVYACDEICSICEICKADYFVVFVNYVKQIILSHLILTTALGGRYELIPYFLI